MGRSLRITLFVLLLLVVLIFGLTVGRQVFLGSSEPAPAPDLSQYNTYVYDQPRELAEFTLTNEQGETVTRDSLKGRWTFVFVGYTTARISAPRPWQTCAEPTACCRRNCPGRITCW